MLAAVKAAEGRDIRENEDWMNSPYGSSVHLNEESWYCGAWGNTPSSDGDYSFDHDAFLRFNGPFAQLSTGLQEPSSWLDATTTPSAPLTIPDDHFDYEQHVWFMTNAQTGQPPEPLPPASNRGHHDAGLMCIPHNGAIFASTPPLDGLGITAGDHCTYPLSTAADQLSVAPENLQQLFPIPSLPREKPPLYDDKGRSVQMQEQKPRFEGDIYTALWIRGEGVERAGWCGFCPSWHKLKDSAYWYHLHYSHGIACSSGRPMDPPRKLRWNGAANVNEAFCGTCEEWISIGRGQKMRTAYWRHAYRCFAKGMVKPPGRSPRRTAAVPDL